MDAFSRALLFTALPVACAGAQSAASWEEELAKGLVPYHQLAVNDFKVDDHAHPEADYWVKTFIDPQYHYTETLAPDGTVHTYVSDWAVFSGLDKNDTVRKSSMRKMKAELPYAQALFDLAEIRARELAALTPAAIALGAGRHFRSSARESGREDSKTLRG